MVWGAISTYGVSSLQELDRLQDSIRYVNVLENNLPEFSADNLGKTYIFQQDNSSIHRSKYTKRWLKENNITVLDWPAKFPDLNII